MASSKFTIFQWWKTALSIKILQCHIKSCGLPPDFFLPLHTANVISGRPGRVRGPLGWVMWDILNLKAKTLKNPTVLTRKKQLVVILMWRLCHCFFSITINLWCVFFAPDMFVHGSIHAQGHICQMIFAWDKNKKHSVYLLTYMSFVWSSIKPVEPKKMDAFFQS